ncbi:hypothetical protein D3880_10735 [Pseudomonas cavernae]|uniref:DUF2214 domain-containing protein n=1 Tax=Pseudomonas cavernae TaxID=2320867 RepID=A0A385Z4E2_9PSED|nr:hypothetical protein [Pseudomonas cavernae]AYC32823.1 hypothetical protein D3880_10735 [Pseudomonas cavernae]
MEIYLFFTSLLKQEGTMELLRLAIVYAHLIACCVAIGMVIVSDSAMIKRLITGDTSQQDPHHLVQLKNTVLIALAALWITGLMIIGLDASIKGEEYFLNPKLQAKILIVALLTINGFLLHHVVMPAMTKAGCILKLEANARTLAVFAGTVSGVSWLYAAMLGVGRPLAWKYSLQELLIAYPLLIAAGFAMMLLLIDWKTSRSKTKPAPRMAYAGILAVNHR